MSIRRGWIVSTGVLRKPRGVAAHSHLEPRHSTEDSHLKGSSCVVHLNPPDELHSCAYDPAELHQFQRSIHTIRPCLVLAVERSSHALIVHAEPLGDTCLDPHPGHVCCRVPDCLLLRHRIQKLLDAEFRKRNWVTCVFCHDATVNNNAAGCRDDAVCRAMRAARDGSALNATSREA
jgi:hypothetical protein